MAAARLPPHLSNRGIFLSLAFAFLPFLALPFFFSTFLFFFPFSFFFFFN